ncbi:coiled-coil domain-containing protein 27 [Herpailurus yagouaroundi]|uniref:coiled-coil domain-containing protein 27 n=1 Tax=Herpailurus yagouaroundi TaxID=1608482 RepID=UPI001AD7E04E|nr:coiled-coil domain-containing protein 27 [Puma yagouaroundi]
MARPVSMETSVMPHTLPGSHRTRGFRSRSRPGLSRRTREPGSRRGRPSTASFRCPTAVSAPALRMLRAGALPPKKRSLEPNPLEKGMLLLQSVAGHGTSARALSRFHGKMDGRKQDASAEDTSFTAELEELRKVFLTRPHCPRFSTRATSMCPYGSAISAELSEELRVALDSWKATQDPLSGRQVDGCLLPFSKSACEFNYLRTSESRMVSPVPSSPVLAHSQLRKRVPWYISVIHEKDHCLRTLGEEVQRLSQLEALLRKKDEEVSALQEEREALKKQLKFLLQSKSQERLEQPSESAPKPLGKLSILRTFFRDEEELQHRRQPQDECSATHRGKDLEVDGGQEDEAGEAEGGTGSGEAAPEEGVEVEVEQLEEEEGQGAEAQSKRSSSSLEDAFERELVAQLEEYEQVIWELQDELQVTRTRYSLATGAITSLQRRVGFQESRLRQVHTESEALRRELREREDQLRAMSNKFSNLREDKKHEEMMGLMEKDNFLLRQQVASLLCSSGRAGVVLGFEEQDPISEPVHGMEPSSRGGDSPAPSLCSQLERLRNNIMQATFSTSGIKSLATEISDNDILEALQRIISERADCYNQLKQKGIRMPPLHQSEAPSSQSKSKKLASK